MSKRERRDQKRARKEHLRGNAVRLTGPILGPGGGFCAIVVLVGNPQSTQLVRIRAIIDTGATTSCVSEPLAAKLGLVPHGKTQVTVVGSTQLLDQAPMVIGVAPPNGTVFFKIIPVTIGKLPAPMLFGMSELEPGTLIVDTANKTWEWKISNAVLGSTKPPAHPSPTEVPKAPPAADDPVDPGRKPSN